MTSVEYALLAALIFAVIAVGAHEVGISTGALFDQVARFMAGN